MRESVLSLGEGESMRTRLLSILLLAAASLLLTPGSHAATIAFWQGRNQREGYAPMWRPSRGLRRLRSCLLLAFCMVVVAPRADAVVFALDGGASQIVRLDPDTGNILGSFAAPESTVGGDGGLAFDGSVLYFTTEANGSDTIYALDPANGSVLDSFTDTAFSGITGLSSADASTGIILFSSKGSSGATPWQSLDPPIVHPSVPSPPTSGGRGVVYDPLTRILYTLDVSQVFAYHWDLDSLSTVGTLLDHFSVTGNGLEAGKGFSLAMDDGRLLVGGIALGSANAAIEMYDPADGSFLGLLSSPGQLRWTAMATIPEPSPALLVGLGLAGLATRRRRP